jgi:hypothetical protein
MIQSWEGTDPYIYIVPKPCFFHLYVIESKWFLYPASALVSIGDPVRADKTIHPHALDTRKLVFLSKAYSQFTEDDSLLIVKANISIRPRL